MIEVRLFASLAGEPGQGTKEFQVEAGPGLTVADVIRQAGIETNELYVIAINGQGAKPDSPLADGDRLALFPPMSGG
ncbi:MAG TPA: MoaD/ThiS family protein [Thermoleophilia bacterium]|nr:MoaD/ThiS family protein [Thermoleophilia bacterium]